MGSFIFASGVNRLRRVAVFGAVAFKYAGAPEFGACATILLLVK